MKLGLFDGLLTFAVKMTFMFDGLLPFPALVRFIFTTLSCEDRPSCSTQLLSSANLQVFQSLTFDLEIINISVFESSLFAVRLFCFVFSDFVVPNTKIMCKIPHICAVHSNVHVSRDTLHD